MEVFVAIAAKIAEYTVAPVGQWLGYSFRYSSNIAKMKNWEEKLQNAGDRVRHSTEAAERNGEAIEADVIKWLTEVDEITELAKKVHEGEEEAKMRCCKGVCLSLKLRHQLSRKAKNLVKVIGEALENGKFDRISYRPAPQGIVTTRYMDCMEFVSRMPTMMGLKEALGDANINVIGLWGMPGVGKTTLIREIGRQVKEDKLFDEVALADVTQSQDLRRIQGEIADMLDLKLDAETIRGRAIRLRERLTKEKEKRILVILDDIWAKLDLEAIGIDPCKGCKVVLVSRQRDLLSSEMRVQKDFGIEELPEKEAWELFEKMAADSVKDPKLRSIATEVAKECGGLPIALATVSKALNNKDLCEWKDALQQLRHPAAPEHLTTMQKTIYSCIEFSFTRLENEEIKYLFLYCAQMGFSIYRQDLLKYCYGLGLFHGINTLEHARNRLHRLLRNLKDSCLLQDIPHDSRFCHMHDVVRDVATLIASKDYDMLFMKDDGGLKEWLDMDALKRCKAVSIGCGDIPNELECPELRFLHVNGRDRSLQIPDTFFQGMEKLKVLDLTAMELSSLPSSLLLLRNLQTLCLDQCELGDISGIGELKNLVVLSLLHSDISTFPREIGSLVRLRLLDLSNCSKLEVIPPNVLSRLVELEELYMENSFVQWEAEGLITEKSNNANLAELKYIMLRLTTLEIHIQDACMLPRDLQFEKLERYNILVGDVWDWSDKHECSRTLKLKLKTSFQSEVGIKMLLNRTECLYLDELKGVKSVLHELDREGFQQLKHLHIQNNDEIKYIIISSPMHISITISFPALEIFHLKNMTGLEDICHGQLHSTSFRNLRVLKVESCEKLKFVFPSSVARDLSQLQELQIRECSNMGAIVVKEGGEIEDTDMIFFPQLRHLALEHLPKLISFLRTKNSLGTEAGEIVSEGTLDFDMPILHEQVSFPSLQTLHMKDLPKIKHVWSCGQEPKTVFRCLEQLKILGIEDCGVEEIVVGGGEPVARTILEFPRVTVLRLINLKRLKWFYKGVHVTKWPMLEMIWIEGCEKVEIFASGVVSFEEMVKERSSEMFIKQPIFLVDELSFSSLKTLYICNMDKLKIICQDQVAASSFSKNIQYMNICICEKLLHVFQSNFRTTTISTQRLTCLCIWDCSSLETIFRNMEGHNGKAPQVLIAPSSGTKESVAREDRTARHIEFPILTEMRLARLPNLKWILEGVHTNLECPSLEILELWECEQVIWASKFASSSSSQETSQLNQLQTRIQLPLPNLLELELGICQVKLPSTSFKKLRVLKLENCEKIRFVFPSSIARGLSLLERLEIRRCNNMGVIVVKEEKDGIEDGDVILFQQLQNLVLEGLPELVSFLSTRSSFMTDCGQIIAEGNRDLHMPLLHHQASFPNLQTLHIVGLPKIKHVWSCGQEPKIVFRYLKQVWIRNCGVEEIVAAGEGGREVVARTLEFPQVTYLSLINLKRLKWFYKGVHVTKWPMLEMISIEGCEKVEIFASGVVSFEETVKERSFEMSIKQPLFLVDEASFPSLQTLRIVGLPKIKHVWSCGQEPKIVFRYLKQVYIENCGVEEIVAADEGGREVVARTLEFPRVTCLSLISLKRLKWFYKGVHVTKWPMLEMISIEGCEKVEIFASGVVSFEETVKERSFEMSIKQPLFLVDELSFSSLKKLLIHFMDKLEIICQDQVAASSFSKNIQDMNIFRCEKLLHVFQSNFHTTTSLTQRLTHLCIQDCSSLETIFRHMEGHNGKAPQVLIAPSSGTEESVVREDETARHIEFPILIEMTLYRLPKLKWILEGVHTNLECPSLERLVLWECEQVILASKFASSSSSQETSQQNQLQTCIQLQLPNLLEFELGISHVKLPSTSFKKLRVLQLKNCEKLRFIFPSSIARGLSLLERLEIRRCNNMGVIVVKEERDRIEDGDVILFHQLQTLVLEDLPELVSFLSTSSSFLTDSGQIITEGNRDLHMSLLHHQVAFPNLTKLHIRNLPKIKHIWRKDSQTTVTFQNLQKITAKECASLKSLFPASIGTCLKQLKKIRINDCGVLEEIVGAEGGEAMGRTLVLEFPQVTCLYLENLPRLECFYKGVHISKWPMLKEMRIRKCEKVEVFASGFVSKETVDERQFQMSIKQPLFLVDEMPFPSLEILRIHEMEKLEIIWNIKDSHQRHTYNFPNRIHIDVSLCESLKSLFPAALVAASLPQLQSIMIIGCAVMEEIVEREDGTDPTTRLLFPSLICLGLYGLPKLKWFFQGLRTLESSSSKELHEQGGTLFVVEEVAFPNLNLLDLYGLPKINHVWSKDSQTIPSFQNLQVIIAGKCVSLKSLFPASIVRCLEQLEKIKVYDCGVEEIVAAEGGGEVEMTVVFPQVTSLCLENLRRLKGVDDSKCLMLKKMRILECENVKLSFPSLVTLKIRRKYKLEIMSRNVTIRKLWRSCYARCLHANESYRLREALMPEYILWNDEMMMMYRSVY